MRYECIKLLAQRGKVLNFHRRADANIYVPKYLFQIHVYSELYLAHNQKKYHYFVVLVIAVKKYETCKNYFCHQNRFSVMYKKGFHASVQLLPEHDRNASLDQVKKMCCTKQIYT